MRRIRSFSRRALTCREAQAKDVLGLLKVINKIL
jgi:hypothetical protein